MNQLSKFAAVCLIVSTLAACSSSNSAKDINYRHSEITPTLEIPPDLISRTSKSNLALPGSGIGTAENTGRYVETGNLNIEPRTLPLIENIKIEGQGDLHWLTVFETAENVYPHIRNFWLEQGFELLLDEPAVGIMETEWSSNRSGSDSFFASILESMRGADSKDQYKTRLERSADDESTRVYIAHRAQELMIEEEKISVLHQSDRSRGWQFIPADPAREYEMLSRLMISLGMRDQAVKAELEKIGLFSAMASIQYDEDDEQTYLLVNYGFDRSWNRLLHRFDRLNINVVDRSKDETDGAVTISSNSLPDDLPQLFEGQENLKVALTGSANSSKSRIDIINVQGVTSKSDSAKQLLHYLQKQLK